MAFKVFREDFFGDSPKLLHTIEKAGDALTSEELIKAGKAPADAATAADAEVWAKKYRDSVQGVRIYVQEVSLA
jgi:hypothetical protein